MAKDAEKRKDKLYNVLALLLMAALFGCGVWGVVESRIAKRDYKNSPDVRQVSAVVSSYRTIESKDDDGDVIRTEYEAKLIFEVDGQSYTGRETYYREVSNGEIVTVEVYQTPKGSYKVAPEGNPVGFSPVLHRHRCGRLSHLRHDLHRFRQDPGGYFPRGAK